MLDPSQLYRPEEKFEEYNKAQLKKSRTDKSNDDFRNYEENLNTEMVLQTYTLMHTYQTLDFARSKVCLSKKKSLVYIGVDFGKDILTREKL